MEEFHSEVETGQTGEATGGTVRNDMAMKLVAEMLATKTVEVRPQFDFTTEMGFTYPVVEETLKVKGEEAVAILEYLTARGILKKSFSDRLFHCPRCRSINMRPTLHCPKCNSGDIVRGRVLEHLVCKYVGVEEEFMVKGRYICPRCKAEPRIIGIDYQSLGVQRKCRDCGEMFDVPLIRWRCLKCSSRSDEDRVGGTDVFLYSLDETKRDWLEFELQSKAQFVKLLRQQGYEVTEDARVKGRSGAEHSIDMLATRDDGIVTHDIAIGVEITRDKIGPDRILDFDAKAYDGGFHNKMLIVIPELSEEARRFAQLQRIEVLEPGDLERVLAGDVSRPGREIEMKPFKFESKSQLIQYLERAGYEVKENAEVKGRSGAAHHIDILATRDEGIIIHRIAIGIEVGERAMGLDRIFDFDDKAYDTGILNKVLIAVPGLTREAKAFARHQRIRVLEVKQLEPATEENPES